MPMEAVLVLQEYVRAPSRGEAPGDPQAVAREGAAFRAPGLGAAEGLVWIAGDADAGGLLGRLDVGDAHGAFRSAGQRLESGGAQRRTEEGQVQAAHGR